MLGCGSVRCMPNSSRSLSSGGLFLGDCVPCSGRSLRPVCFESCEGEEASLEELLSLALRGPAESRREFGGADLSEVSVNRELRSYSVVRGSKLVLK
mmetsp:Transcript_96192/g.200939  ORF Transcript_96192/g.200939 Transcript_96192/m.200939 type:complete len:97 (-) Transcript_96192:613-903(-)